MAKQPKWKKDFKARMRAHDKALAAAFRSSRLTKWEYTNGKVELKRPIFGGGRARYIWYPNKRDNANDGMAEGQRE